MIRLASYLLSCAVLGLVLWWMAIAKVDWILRVMWVAAWIVGLMVTWKVARREGRRPVAWVIAALLIGPFAWFLMAIPPIDSTSPQDAPDID